MSNQTQKTWLSAYGVSIGIHLLLVGAIALCLAHKPSVGGDGLITVDLMGSGGGQTGGQGQKQLDALRGDGGTNGDNRHLSKHQDNTQSNEQTQGLKQEGLTKSPVVSESYGLMQKDAQNVAPLKQSKYSEVKKDAPKIISEKSEIEKRKPLPETKVTPPLDSKLKKENNHKELIGKKNIEKVAQHTAHDGQEKGVEKKSSGGVGGVLGSVGAQQPKDGKQLSSIGQGTGMGVGSGEYISNGDGSFTAMNSKGLDYKIIFEQPAKYPKRARSIGYAKPVKVSVRFLVGIDGKVEKTELLSKNIPNLGFEEAALLSIRSIEFAPIQTKNGKPLKVWFKKTIIFKP